MPNLEEKDQQLVAPCGQTLGWFSLLNACNIFSSEIRKSCISEGWKLKYLKHTQGSYNLMSAPQFPCLSTHYFRSAKTGPLWLVEPCSNLPFGSTQGSLARRGSDCARPLMVKASILLLIHSVALHRVLFSPYFVHSFIRSL